MNTHKYSKEYEIVPLLLHVREEATYGNENNMNPFMFLKETLKHFFVFPFFSLFFYLFNIQMKNMKKSKLVIQPT